MPVKERAASVVLALKTYGNLHEVYLGGYGQFLILARPILRNWGVATGDYDMIWRMLEFAEKNPKEFLRLCEEMDRAKRIPEHLVQ